MEKIKNAIIIHGPGRSGTTLLNAILSLHKDFYWISGYTNKYPEWPILTMANNLQRIKWFEKFTRNKKKFPRPSEPYGFWKYFFKDFNRSRGEPRAEELKAAINAIRKMENYSMGHRFITKLTGVARLEYIDPIFEDPIILWIDRNPEAVVMSYFKQKWNYKSKPELFKAKSKLDLIEEYSSKYQLVLDEKVKLKKFRFVQLFYEDLVSNPIGFFEELCQTIDLPMTDEFRALIGGWEIYMGSNESYKKELSPEELDFLKEKLHSASRELGYR